MADRQDQLVWIVTDVPFWERRNGSHQRIISLARALSNAEIPLELWQIGSLTKKSQQAIDREGIFRRIGGPGFPPEGWGRRIRWEAQAITAAVRSRSLRDSSNDESSVHRLDDFRVPEIGERFAEDVHRLRPRAILIEYISLGYLLDFLAPTDRQSILCLLDAHDVMHLRCDAMRQVGLENWLEISREEECRALAKFDGILAIQPEEKREFQEMLPNAQVTLCGHAIDSAIDAVRHASSRAFRIGYVGGPSKANEVALRRFVNECWDRIRAASPRDVELCVAGGVGAAVADLRDSSQGIRIDGYQDDLRQWYAELDLVINPIEHGTGLKIKSVEALAHGRPLVTTPCGAAGLQTGASNGILVADSIASMAESINRLAAEIETHTAMTKAAIRNHRQNHQGESVYAPVIQLLKSAGAKS